MARFGYIYLSLNDRYIREQLLEIRKSGVKQTIFSESDMSLLQPRDELVIYELKSLGKTVVQMAAFMEKLERKKIQLTILKKDVFMESLTNEQFLALLYDLAGIDRFVISERTSKGIQLAKQNGRVGGRPKLSEKTAKQIKYLYKNRGYSLREIADECDVSLGTAYKYVNKKDTQLK